MVQRHLVHCQSCATTASPWFQNFPFLPKNTPYPLPFPSTPWATSSLLYIHMDFSVLDLSSRRTLCVWLLSRTITGIRYLLAVVRVGALFFSVAGYHANVRMHRVLMICSFTDEPLAVFTFWLLQTEPREHSHTRVCLDTYSHFSWIYSWEWISGVYRNAMLNVTRRRHAVFRNDYTILCSHNQ